MTASAARPGPDLSLEAALLRADPACAPVCGIDEAGRKVHVKLPPFEMAIPRENRDAAVNPCGE